MQRKEHPARWQASLITQPSRGHVNGGSSSKALQALGGLTDGDVPLADLLAHRVAHVRVLKRKGSTVRVLKQKGSAGSARGGGCEARSSIPICRDPPDHGTPIMPPFCSPSVCTSASLRPPAGLMDRRLVRRIFDFAVRSWYCQISPNLPTCGMAEEPPQAVEA